MNQNHAEDIDNLNVPDEFVEITSLLKLHRKEIRGRMFKLLHFNFSDNCEESKSQLMKIMEYSVFSGRRYYRSFFLRILGEALGVSKTKSLFIGSIVEMLHNYATMLSLMQEIENDDYRYGRDTCHKKFGNAQTMIASNALINLIIEIVSSNNLLKIQDNIRCKIIKTIAKYTGKDGVSGGQMMKVIIKKKQKCSQDEKTRIKRLKLNSLFNAGSECIELLSNVAEEQDAAIKNYINNFCNLMDLYEEYQKNKSANNNLLKQANSFTSQGCKTIAKIQNNEKLISFIKYINYCLQQLINDSNASKPIVCTTNNAVL